MLLHWDIQTWKSWAYNGLGFRDQVWGLGIWFHGEASWVQVIGALKQVRS